MRTESALLLHLGLVVLLQTCQGFHLPVGQQHRLRATLSSSSSRVRQVARFAATNNNNDGGGLAPAATEDETQVDNLLEQGQLRRAARFFQEHPSLSLTRERWSRVFDAVENRLREAASTEMTTTMQQQQQQLQQLQQQPMYPLMSPARTDMTEMYKTLKELNHLKLFGAVSSTVPPADGSHIVTPLLLEEISGVSMKALTPKPTNRLLIAGVVLSGLEAVLSLSWGLDFNLLVLATLVAGLADQVLVNGAVFDTVARVLNPGMGDKILRHEAGHLLMAYLLGCPVEGYVLSPWAAQQDARFDRAQVSAGTSFFDPNLSEQIHRAVVSRSTLDRYSIIVMGGIAAEALLFGQADGGAGDEAALVGFLSQLNAAGTPGKKLPPWNDVSIRNQARWGALQAVLMLREYKPCYDALVQAMERGGSLGDCIYAMEKAGRDKGLSAMTQPLGYIQDKGMYGEWTKEPPTTTTVMEEEKKNNQTPPLDDDKPKPVATKFNKEESMALLGEIRKQMETRLQELDDEINKLDA